MSALVAPHAAATSIGDLRAQAEALQARIGAMGAQEGRLSERYDAAVLQLRQAQANVARARQEVAAADRKVASARAVLLADAVNAYVSSGSGSLSGSGPANSIAGANASLLRAEYQQTLAVNQSDSEYQYRLAGRQASAAEANLKVQEMRAAANITTIAGDEKRVAAAQVVLEATEAQVKGRIATLIAQQQAAARQAAQLAAEQRLAAQRAAAAQAAAAQAAAVQAKQIAPAPVATTVPAAAPTVQAPSSAAAAAVAAAESRVGDPYVYAAAGPNAFDCSGLVMWAYAQAGVSLPHYSGAQYDDTTHISMSELEPGDLVFFSDPGQHVAMYVGNGEVVQAPYTGADVQIVPLYSEFTLASRVVG
jgi:cell wall-associated NlpC family hydrolase